MMNTNEQQYLESICNVLSDVTKAQKYIKETFNIDTEYDVDNNRLLIESSDDKLSMSLAKDYATQTLDEKIVEVEYKK